MQRFREGDLVRVDIPDKDDPDYAEYHGRIGEVIAVLQDAAGTETGDERDSFLFRIQFEKDEEMDFRWRDLRPAPNRD
jgi:ribosomal protein L21E